MAVPNKTCLLVYPMKTRLRFLQTAKALLGELRTACLHLAVFLVVLILPENTHLRAFRTLARLHRLLLNVEPAAANLMENHDTAMPSQSAAAHNIALHQLLAYADFYLILFYKDRWLENNTVINGVLPNKESHNCGPLFLTLHYGQGVWAYDIFRRLGLPLTRLHAPPPNKSLPGSILADKLGHWRARQLERFAGTPSITPGGSVEKMRHLMCDQRIPVVAMPDVPLRPNQNRINVRLLDQPSALANGVIDLAVREHIPVYVYTMATDLSSGKRVLDIQGPYNFDHKQDLAQKISDIATAAIKKDPCAWHLWPWAKHIMQSEPSHPE